jgi:DNA-binding NtrC family response regulator
MAGYGFPACRVSISRAAYSFLVDGPRGAAKILGLHPNTLRKRLKKLGIERDSHRPR